MKKVISGLTVLAILSSSVLSSPVSVLAKNNYRVMSASEAINARNIVIENYKGQKIKIDGSKTAVGVLDDAIDPNHPGLKIAPKSPKVSGGKLILGRNWGDNNNDFSGKGDSYHGLHVAGIVGANGPESTDPSAPLMQGVAPETQIIFEKVFDKNGNSKDEDIKNAIKHAISSGADVITMSLGTDSSTMNMANTINQAVNEAFDSGVVVIATSGNEGYVGSGINNPLSSNPDYGLVARPGMYPKAICTSAYQNAKFKAGSFTVEGIEGSIYYGEPRERGWVTVPNETVDYVYIENPTEENIVANNVVGKYILIKEKGNDEYLNGSKYPKFINAILKAKEIGAKGVMLINKVDEVYYPRLYKWNSGTGQFDWDINKQVFGYPVFGVSSSDGEKLINAQNKSITTTSESTSIDAPNALKLRNFSSRGVSSDFVFKGDIAAPSGGQVWSLGNLKINGETKYVAIDKHGTSMAAPQIAGAAALVKQRIKEQYPELIMQNAQTSYLIKNLLLSTSIPQVQNDGVFYSPRGQGNGLVNVKNACMTDVITSSPRTNDIETGFSKTNLREIKNNKIEFKVNLTNYGKKARTYKPYLWILNDKVENGHYTMESEQMVAPIELPNVTVNPRTGQVIPTDEKVGNPGTPGKEEVNISYTIPADIDAKLKNLSKNGYFVDGYVQFIPQDNDNEVELWHSFTGFNGNWLKIPVYDKFVYDMDTENGERPFYYKSTPDDNKGKRDGDINSTHLETYLNRKRVILGQLPDYTKENMKVSDSHLAISPDGDGKYDEINPTFTMLRNFDDIFINIDDEKGSEVFSGSFGLGTTDKGKNFYGPNGLVTENAKALTWNGKVNGKVVEGEYTYKTKVVPDIINRLNPVTENLWNNIDEYVAKKDFKIKVDITPPVLKETKIIEDNGQNIKFKLLTEDPKLLNTETPGSGIYSAKLIINKEEKNINFDSRKDNSLDNTEITLSKKEFETAKVILTDWARNSKEYNLKDNVVIGEVGSLIIDSLDENSNSISISYTAESLKTGIKYNSFNNLPVGKYKVYPVDIQKGYNLKGSSKIVTIKKNKVSNLKFDYQKVNYIHVSISTEDTAKPVDTVNYIGKNDININLVNLDTNMVYKLKRNMDFSTGWEYAGFSANVPAGVYEVKFVNNKEKDMYISNGNITYKYLAIPNNTFNIGYSISLEDPNINYVIRPNLIENYVENQTYIKMQGTDAEYVGIRVYELGDVDMDESSSFDILSSDEGNKLYTIKNRDGSGINEYIIDLSPSNIEKLKPGMLFRSFIVKNGEKIFENDDKSFVNIVGNNHVYLMSQIMYINNILSEKQDLEQEKRKSLEEKIKKLKSLAAYGDNGDVFKDRKFINIPSDSSHSYDLEDQVYRLKSKAYEETSKLLEELYTELNVKKSDVPFIFIHGGYFTNLEYLQFQKPPHDEDEYEGKEARATALTLDIPSLVAMQSEFFKPFDPIHNDKPLTSLENLEQIGILSELKDDYDFSGWEEKDSSNVNINGNEENPMLSIKNNGTAHIYLKLKEKEDRMSKLLEELKEATNTAKGYIRNNNGDNSIINEKIDFADKIINNPIRKPELIENLVNELKGLVEPETNNEDIETNGDNDIVIVGNNSENASSNRPIRNRHKDKEVSIEKELKPIVTTPIYEVKKLENNPASKEKTFKDTVNHWANNVINYVVGKGYFTGINKNEFRPDDKLTRGQLVTVLGRYFKGSSLNKAGLKDVKEGEYYSEYINWAVENGIVSGYEDGTFKADKAITREEVAVILDRASKKMSIKEKYSSLKIEDIKDKEKISSWAKDSVKNSIEKGWLKGDNTMNYNPSKTLTRAELAQIIYNIDK